LFDIGLKVTVELGRTEMTVRDVLSLGLGSIIELNKVAGEPVDILVNGRPIARGEVVVVDDMFGVRVIDILSPYERVNSLR
jgi:flagellar motor switch protein FliN/FliY